MRELAVILVDGAPVYWHEPADATSTYIPDSRAFFDELWSRRDQSIAVAHLHPWSGRAVPSSIDLETFEALDIAFGRHIEQYVVTFDDAWSSVVRDVLPTSWLDELRARGKKKEHT